MYDFFDRELVFPVRQRAGVSQRDENALHYSDSRVAAVKWLILLLLRSNCYGAEKHTHPDCTKHGIWKEFVNGKEKGNKVLRRSQRMIWQQQHIMEYFGSYVYRFQTRENPSHEQLCRSQHMLSQRGKMYETRL